MYMKINSTAIPDDKSITASARLNKSDLKNAKVSGGKEKEVKLHWRIAQKIGTQEPNKDPVDQKQGMRVDQRSTETLVIVDPN